MGGGTGGDRGDVSPPTFQVRGNVPPNFSAEFFFFLLVQFALLFVLVSWPFPILLNVQAQWESFFTFCLYIKYNAKNLLIEVSLLIKLVVS